MSEFGANKRAFNEIKVDSSRGWLTKTSTDEEKLVKEILWYIEIPDNLKYLTPRILSHDLKQGTTSVTMELYGYKALNSLWLSDEYDEHVWDRVFEGIETALNDMSDYIYDAPTYVLNDSAHEMYVEKTLSRLKRLGPDPRFQEDFKVNSNQVLGLKSFHTKFHKVVSALGLDKLKKANVIHGDFCLSNILFEPDNGFIRLIDPRGSFGKLFIHGDPDYELAKLSHSFDGNYDFYINGEFVLQIEDQDIVFATRLSPHHHLLKARFDAWLVAQTTDRNHYLRIKAIQALLFLSMIPLHQDRPRSQQAFYIQGLRDFTQIVSELGI